MHRIMIVSLLGLAGLALAGCSTSATPEGVLPRTDLPPPPSIGRSQRDRATTSSVGAQPQRRGLSVPSTLVPPRPAPRS
ncbi:hypothetical protein [Microvirga guangxiensis]|uniref:Uncharacterized protein n=1 Tax=Microvirga guangxiensis TaxID=549386 RepID=A0A1G5BC68_9HYPH|nr:hypothetical protein [Microvirga guangxiensis]SCX87733.1 hypothetical protein SAMN02927923_00193 [Microvirga guangxiensis]